MESQAILKAITYAMAESGKMNGELWYDNPSIKPALLMAENNGWIHRPSISQISWTEEGVENFDGMEVVLSSTAIELIKERVQLELLKRGFTAKIKTMEEDCREGNYDNRLEFSTESFQTSPVIFKSVCIGNFGSAVYENKPGSGTYQVSMGVRVFYKSFNGGGNSTKIFDFKCNMEKYGNEIWGCTID